MSAPTSLMSKLSLESMSPTTREMARQAPPPASPSRDSEDSSSEPDSDSDASAFDDDSDVIRSPTKLLYRLDGLSGDSKAVVRDAFNDPPKMALQRCRLIDNTYAFQMTELVTRSIRITGPGTNTSPSSRLSCSCNQEDDGLCTHLVWMLDQITKQTLYDQEHNRSMTMTSHGYAREMGDPFDNVSKYHLDILADGLHCQIVDPEAELNDDIDPRRVLESRELLSAVYAAPPEEFRPDIFTSPSTGKKIIKRHDLDHTIFRMLLDNHHFFQYFLSHSGSTDPIIDPFRKLSQRVDHVLRNLDSYSKPTRSSTSPSAETPRNVTWAATHLVGCVQLIRTTIYKRDRPLELREAISAARSLVHILSAVVSRNKVAHPGASRRDRNLYLALIGDLDQDFVIRELNLIPEAASQFLHSLEDIHEQLGSHGAPPSYIDKFRNLLARLRTSSAGASLKRPGQGDTADRGSKRMK